MILITDITQQEANIKKYTYIQKKKSVSHIIKNFIRKLKKTKERLFDTKEHTTLIQIIEDTEDELSEKKELLDNFNIEEIYLNSSSTQSLNTEQEKKFEENTQNIFLIIRAKEEEIILNEEYEKKVIFSKELNNKKTLLKEKERTKKEIVSDFKKTLENIGAKSRFDLSDLFSESYAQYIKCKFISKKISGVVKTISQFIQKKDPFMQIKTEHIIWLQYAIYLFFAVFINSNFIDQLLLVVKDKTLQVSLPKRKEQDTDTETKNLRNSLKELNNNTITLIDLQKKLMDSHEKNLRYEQRQMHYSVKTHSFTTRSNHNFMSGRPQLYDPTSKFEYIKSNIKYTNEHLFSVSLCSNIAPCDKIILENASKELLIIREMLC